MNIETGEILDDLEGENYKKRIKGLDEEGRVKELEKLLEIKIKDITKKQMQSMWVSKYDNRSVLGKKFTKERTRRRNIK